MWPSASHRTPSRRSRPSTRSTPAPAGRGRRPPTHLHAPRPGPGHRRTSWPLTHHFPPTTPIVSHGAGPGVDHVGEPLDEPALGPRQLGDALGTEGRARPGRRRRGRRGQRTTKTGRRGGAHARHAAGEVLPDEDQRRLEPGAQRCRASWATSGVVARGSSKPQQLVEQGLVGGHEERSGDASTAAHASPAAADPRPARASPVEHRDGAAFVERFAGPRGLPI